MMLRLKLGLLLLLLVTLVNCDTHSNSDPNQNPNPKESSEKKEESQKADDEHHSPLSRSIPFHTRNPQSDYFYENRDRDLTSSSSSSSLTSSVSTSAGYTTKNNNNFETTKSSAMPETVISSTSYSIKPGSSGGSSSNVYINTKPTPIIISRDPPSGSNYNNNNNYNNNDRYHSSPPSSSAFPQSSSSYFGNGHGNSDLRRGPSGNFATGNVNGNSWTSNKYSPNSDCFNGRNCPKGEIDDEHRTYYSVLNGNLKYPERLHGAGGGGIGARRNSGGTGAGHDLDIASSNKFYERRAIFPFRVHGIGPDSIDKYTNRFYPDSDDDFPKRRVTRTSTTSSPSWVKLQPMSPHKVYDPFFSRDNERHVNSPSGESGSSTLGDEKYENVQFANRIGIELSPESFAERWGYGNTKGSRLPSWLEELNYQHKHHDNNPHNRRPYGAAHSGPTRDEDPQNWVKLDPIPVAGVSISKWVPKGTSPSELPSTGDLIRDKTTAWWDRNHHEQNSHHIKRPSLGWGSSSNSHPQSTSYNNRYPPHLHETKRPTVGNDWADIIYPNTPSSATASWESSTTLKGLATYPSSFGGSSSNSGGWKSPDNTRRGPVASWSASNTKLGNNNRFGIRRPVLSGSPSNYPDPHAHDDDPRWILVSNSRRVSNNLINSDRHKYRPHINGYKDDLSDDLSAADTNLYESDGERIRDRDRERDRIRDRDHDHHRHQHHHHQQQQQHNNHGHGHKNHHHHSHHDHEIDRDDGSPYFNSHRLAKNYKLVVSPLMALDPEQVQTTPSNLYDDDDNNKDLAFSRINATLQTLTPILNHRKGANNHNNNNRNKNKKNGRDSMSSTTEITTTSTTPTTTTKKPAFQKVTRPPQPPRRQSFLSTLLGTARGSSYSSSPSPLGGNNGGESNNNGTKVVVKKHNSFKPILAAVGAGLLPAGIAAGIALGKRKKRDTLAEEQDGQFYLYKSTKSLYNHGGDNDNNLENSNMIKKIPVTPIVFRNQLYFLPSEQDSFPSSSNVNLNETPSKRNSKTLLSWSELTDSTNSHPSTEIKNPNPNGNQIEQIQRRFFVPGRRQTVFHNKNVIIPP